MSMTQAHVAPCAAATVPPVSQVHAAFAHQVTVDASARHALILHVLPTHATMVARARHLQKPHSSTACAHHISTASSATS